MDRDLVFNTINFDFAFDKEGQGVRRSSARGINTPDVLITGNQQATDSFSKGTMTRYLMRVERHALNSEGVPYRVSFYTVMEVSQHAVAADITAITATYKAAVADADLLADVLNGEL
jgi:hypothetical protein